MLSSSLFISTLQLDDIMLFTTGNMLDQVLRFYYATLVSCVYVTTYSSLLQRYKKKNLMHKLHFIPILVSDKCCHKFK